MSYGLNMETAVLEAPPVDSSIPAKPSGKLLITPQLAPKMQANSVIARRNNKIAREIAKKLPPQLSPNSPRIVTVEAELKRVAQMMNETADVDAYQKLSAARARLFTEWQVLSGTPNPGSAKSRVKRSAGHLSEVQPLSDVQPVVNQPVPQAASNPDLVTVSRTDLQAMITAAVAAALAGKV